MKVRKTIYYDKRIEIELQKLIKSGKFANRSHFFNFLGLEFLKNVK